MKSVLDKWRNTEYFGLWYEDKAEFKSAYELIEDMSRSGMSTEGGGRRALIFHLLKIVEELNVSSVRSPASNVLSGVAGIGKSLVQTEMGPRIPKLFPNICVVYLLMNGLPQLVINMDLELEILKYCRKISGKHKCLLLLDDSEAVFRPDSNSGKNFVDALTGLCRPELPNVVLQIFGSSQVLTDLIQRSMDDEVAKKLGYKGYCKFPAKLNASKLPVSYLCSAQSKTEVKALSKSIASQYNKTIEDDELVVETWYCGGIARLICYFYQKTTFESHGELLRYVWQKVKQDPKSLDYYHELASRMGLIDKVETWQDLIVFVNTTNMFNFLEDTKKYAIDINYGDQLYLLAKGCIKPMEDHVHVVPTFPVCLLIESVRANGKELFGEGLLMEPNVKRDDMVAKAIAAKKNGEGKVMIQSYQLWSHQFSRKSGLPELEQLNLALKKLPNVLANNKEAKSKYHGTICVDLLNFGVINAKISMGEADKVLGKFGKAYFDLCKRLVENKGNSIDYCNAFHRSGDEFAVVCLFDDPNEFAMVIRELANIRFARLSKDKKRKVIAYGRVGGYFRESSQNMEDSFEMASTIEDSIKTRVAKHFGYVDKDGRGDAAAMKNDIKGKNGRVIELKEEEFHILCQIGTDKENKDLLELINEFAQMSIAASDASDGQQEEMMDNKGNKVSDEKRNGDEKKNDDNVVSTGEDS